MAVHRTRAKKIRQTSNRKKYSSTLSYFLLGGLTLLGGAGWYHNTYETNANQKQSGTLANSSAAPLRKTELSSIKLPEIAVKPVSKVPDPVTFQPVAPKAPIEKPDLTSPSIPYRPDTNLPPQARFAVNNAANVIFARVPTAIYTKADSHSKIVANVKAGQEMRSYERQGNWHRVVVPSTNIIGWANGTSLSTRAPDISSLIDGALTGSITP